MRPITEWDQILSERSIISVFNQAGFKTYWLSAQDADGWTGLIPQVTAEARRRRYFDRAYDVLLINENDLFGHALGNQHDLPAAGLV